MIECSIFYLQSSIRKDRAAVRLTKVECDEPDDLKEAYQSDAGRGSLKAQWLAVWGRPCVRM